MTEIKTQQTEKIIRKGFGYEPAEWGDFEELIQQFERTHKRRKNVTQEVLETWEPSTNNDLLLFFECLRTEFPEIQTTSSKENVIFKIPKRIVKFLPSPEAYTRARRSLNKNKIGLPTNQKVIENRSKREKAIKEYFKREKANG